MTAPASAAGVRRLGFGLGGVHGSVLFPRRRTRALIRRAFELGVRLFDAAPSYGAGEAEKRLGEAMAILPREECIVATKAGISASGIASRLRDFSADAIRRSVDDSLARLKLSHIDWLFLHGPDPSELGDGLLTALQALKQAGVVGRLGVAGRGAEIDAALATGLFSLVQAPVHAALPPGDIERLARIRAAGHELIGFEALLPVLERFPAPTSLAAARRLAKNLIRSPEPPPSLDGQAMTAADALRWALGPGGAQRVLVSTTRLSRLEEHAATAESAPPA